MKLTVSLRITKAEAENVSDVKNIVVIYNISELNYDH